MMLNLVLIWGGVEVYLPVCLSVCLSIYLWVIYDPLLKDRRKKSYMSQLFLHFPPTKTSPVKLSYLRFLPQDSFCTCCSKIKLHPLKRNCHLGSNMLSNDIFYLLVQLGLLNQEILLFILSFTVDLHHKIFFSDSENTKALSFIAGNKREKDIISSWISLQKYIYIINTSVA